MERTVQDRRHALGGGMVAGVLGGIAIAVVLVVGALAKGQDIWPAFKGAAAPFLGERATTPGFDGPAVLLGILCHFAVSIGWGVLFAAIFFGLSRGATIAVGALWGIVVWLGMYYVLLPLVGQSQMARNEPVAMAIVSHVIFGLAVAIGFLPFQRTRPHTAPPSRHIPVPLS